MGLINIATEWFFTVSLALFAALMARLLLAYFDKKINFDFKVLFNNANNQEKCIYLSARIIAVCLLVGLVIS